jgi:hypothetical protein
MYNSNVKKFLNGFFVFLGVLFFILILVLAIIYITDGYGIRSLLTGTSSSSSVSDDNASDNTDKNPLLSESQEKVLENIGVDPATLPSEITPEMEECFEEKLGKERADEIKAGDSPTPIDYAKAKGCF